MATPKPAEANKKPKVKGDKPQFPCRSFTQKKPTLAAPTQGLEHIIFDNTGTAKAASTFNFNIKALMEHILNRLKFKGLIAALAIRELKAPTIIFPPDLMDTNNIVKTTKWQRNFNHAHDQQKWWTNNNQKIYNLVMQYSTPEMKMKLLMMDTWTQTSTSQDRIAFLKTDQDISHKKEGCKDATTILDLVWMDKKMFLIHQGPTEPISRYQSWFKGAVDAVELLDGPPWSHLAAIKILYDELFQPRNYITDKTNNLAEYQAAATKSQRQYLVALFFQVLSNNTHTKTKEKDPQ
jgi:hypothetical protein